MRNLIALKTIVFQARLNDHVQKVNHRIRNLSTTKGRQLKDLISLAPKLIEVQERVHKGFDPVVQLLNELIESNKVFKDASLLTTTIHIALGELTFTLYFLYIIP